MGMASKVEMLKRGSDALKKSVMGFMKKIPLPVKAKKIGVDLPAPDPDGIKAPLESVVNGGENAQAGGEWLSLALAGADKAGKAIGLSGITGGAAATAGVLEKTNPVVQGTLTGVDVARMALSPEYREGVRQEGKVDARTDRGLVGEILNQAGYVMSRPAASGSHFFSQVDQIDTDRVNQELKTESTKRQTRAQDEANRQLIASDHLDEMTNGNRQANLNEMLRVLDPDWDLEARTMGLVRNVVSPNLNQKNK